VKRPLSAREREDGELSKQITNIYQQHQRRYGSPRIHAQLRDEGVHIGYKRVVRLMKQAGLAARHRTHRVMTTRADPDATPADNVLDRDAGS
jgi:putative transposase